MEEDEVIVGIWAGVFRMSLDSWKRATRTTRLSFALVISDSGQIPHDVSGRIRDTCSQMIDGRWDIDFCHIGDKASGPDAYHFAKNKKNTAQLFSSGSSLHSALS